MHFGNGLWQCVCCLFTTFHFKVFCLTFYSFSWHRTPALQTGSSPFVPLSSLLLSLLFSSLYCNMWRVEESFRLFLFSKYLWAPSGYVNTSPNLFLPRLLKYFLNSYPLSISSLPLQSLYPACTKVMYGCESWTIKKAECWRIDTFELWCWRRFLRVTWTRSDYSILKEINPEHSLEGLILKLKLQHFGLLMRRNNSLEKTLMLGKTDCRKRRGQQRIRLLDGIIDLMDMNVSKL